MARIRSRELDRWATAMRVTNDDEAMSTLLSVLVSTVLAGDTCRRLVLVTRSAPDESVHRSLLAAQTAFGEIEDAIRPVYRAFVNHVRGRG